jgi:hypothetical protein
MDALRQDLRCAIRSLRKSRGFTSTAVLTLASGIAGTATLFAVLYAVALKPLPFAEPDRLVIIGESLTEPRSEVSYSNFIDWRASANRFVDLAAMGSLNWTFILTGRGDPVPVAYRAVSGNFFDVLGVKPAIGRIFDMGDDQPQAARVALLSDGFWRREFDASPSIIGRVVTLNDRGFTVIGVMPRDFDRERSRVCAARPLAALRDRTD